MPKGTVRLRWSSFDMDLLRATPDNATFVSRYDDAGVVQKFLTVKTDAWMDAGQPNRIHVRINW